MRVHSNNLAQGFAKRLTKQARQGDTWKLNNHDVRETIRTGELVEYNTDFGTRHILLRGESGVCAIVDLDLEEVATVYANDPEDNHRTLNRSRYLFA